MTRLFRAIIHVHAITRSGVAFATIPQWDTDEVVFPIPDNVKVEPGCYLFAMVDLSATSASQMIFEDFEEVPDLEEGELEFDR